MPDFNHTVEQPSDRRYIIPSWYHIHGFGTVKPVPYGLFYNVSSLFITYLPVGAHIVRPQPFAICNGECLGTARHAGRCKHRPLQINLRCLPRTARFLRGGMRASRPTDCVGVCCPIINCFVGNGLDRSLQNIAAHTIMNFIARPRPAARGLCARRRVSEIRLTDNARQFAEQTRSCSCKTHWVLHCSPSHFRKLKCDLLARNPATAARRLLGRRWPPYCADYIITLQISPAATSPDSTHWAKAVSYGMSR